MKNPTEFKTWEDICAALNMNPLTSLEFAQYVPAEDKDAMIAFFKLSKLSKASYGDKQPDWQNEDEYKYWPYFDMNDEDDASGLGFSGSHCAYWCAGTSVGSRLCFPTRAMAEHAGKQFIDWYRDMMVLPKTTTDEKAAN